MDRPMLKICQGLIEANALIYGLTQSNDVITWPSYLFSKFLLRESLHNITPIIIEAWTLTKTSLTKWTKIITHY